MSETKLNQSQVSGLETEVSLLSNIEEFLQYYSEYHDTGWVACSDWTNRVLGDTVDRNLVHNLGVSLIHLEVELYAKTDVGVIFKLSLGQGANTDNLGWGVKEIDVNTLNIRTATNGIGMIQIYVDSSNVTPLTSSAWEYRILVRRKLGQGSEVL